jgi:serine/threonine protein phosphatase 1
MHLPTEVEYPIIAIGDTHGRVTWLEKLLKKLKRLPEWPDAKLVFLGDYVDRCDTVRELVDLIIQVIEDKPGSTALTGNHDLAFMRATGLDGLPPSKYWQQNYGMKYDHRYTFSSYLKRTPEYHSQDDWRNDLTALKEAIPAKHRDFFRALPWCATASGHLFLHNGLSGELDCTAEEQVQFMKQKVWQKALVRPVRGTVSESQFTPDYPVWVGADRGLSANPLPHPHLVQVSGHERVRLPDANRIRIRIDTSGGTVEPLTGCLLRSAKAEPVYIFSNS